MTIYHLNWLADSRIVISCDRGYLVAYKIGLTERQAYIIGLTGHQANKARYQENINRDRPERSWTLTPQPGDEFYIDDIPVKHVEWESFPIPDVLKNMMLKN